MRYVYAKILAVVAGMLAGLMARPALGQLIDFETIPESGTPYEGLVVSDQFQASHGIVFRRLDGGFPVIAEVGSPTTAFQGPPNNTGSDNPVPGQGIGQFFLTDDGLTVGIDPSPIIVEYDPPTAAASGVILDMDVDESFTIDAMDADGTVLETLFIQSGDPMTGDGIATPWNIARESTDIATIRFTGDRSTPGFFGLGFDNFEARTALDTDADGIFDNMDNCLDTANADQRDTDADGFGNACDGDLNNDCAVNFQDLGEMKAVFFSTDAEADLDGDGSVNFVDLGLMKSYFFGPPGPSGVLNICSPE